MANILVCDDAMFMRQTLIQILESAGHTIVGQAQDGVECVEKSKRLNPDIILMDISMPELDGIEATRRIVTDNPEAKIIMVSAMGLMQKVVEAVEAGAKDFVVKPFEAAKIIECINKYI